MRGHEPIIKARIRGYKPAKWVWVDVGSDAGWQAFLAAYSGAEIAPGSPGSTYVRLDPSESARMADWSWTVGLKIMVDGTDEARVMAAADGIRSAGADRVVAVLNDRFMEVAP